jgi:hypothetical protein
MTTNPTMHARQPAARALHEICEAARRVDCGECGALWGEECVYTTGPVSVPVTGHTPLQPVRGYHVARLARAFRRGLISGPDLITVLQATVVFTTATVIHDTVGADAMGGAR